MKTRTALLVLCLVVAGATRNAARADAPPGNPLEGTYSGVLFASKLSRAYAVEIEVTKHGRIKGKAELPGIEGVTFQPVEGEVSDDGTALEIRLAFRAGAGSEQFWVEETIAYEVLIASETELFLYDTLNGIIPFQTLASS